MLGEDHLRSLSTTGACTIIVCAGMCHFARQYFLSARTRSRESAIEASKRRFLERMWYIVTQDTEIELQEPPDLGLPDQQGIFKVFSAENGQCLYLRKSESGNGFEWSTEKMLWLPTSKLLPDALSIDHEILLKRLEAERMLIHKKLAIAQVRTSIMHPPELDLPQFLKNPDTYRGEVCIPQEFRCPLGAGVMSQPVVAPSGLTYDRAVIEQWIATYHTDPATNASLQVSQLYPNLGIRDLIQAWMVRNAHKLDPALLQRVHRDCSSQSSSIILTPDNTPLASSAPAPSVDLASVQGSSHALCGISTTASALNCIHGEAGSVSVDEGSDEPSSATSRSDCGDCGHSLSGIQVGLIGDCSVTRVPRLPCDLLSRDDSLPSNCMRLPDMPQHEEAQARTASKLPGDDEAERVHCSMLRNHGNVEEVKRALSGKINDAISQQGPDTLYSPSVIHAVKVPPQGSWVEECCSGTPRQPESPCFEPPYSWDSDEVLRGPDGHVRLMSAVRGFEDRDADRSCL